MDAINQPTFLTYGADNPILLTDGAVLVQDRQHQDWWKLTPDQHGSYVNGTWTEVASLPAGYAPYAHSCAVLPDGRLIIEGGEYNSSTLDETNMGAIYDPLVDTWTTVNPPAGWTTIGDASSVVLANGTYMQANCCTSQAALLDPKTLTWTETGTGKYDPNGEEGWTLLPTGDVLTVDTSNGTNSELYNPKTGDWSSGGSTIAQLAHLFCGGFGTEIGPAVLRPDGTVFYTGANPCGPGNTAIYDSVKRTWTPGPTFPDDLDIADGPAALETNGKVLMMASPLSFRTPSVFLEWDGKNLTEIPGPPNAPNDSSYYGNMLILPTGQILLTDGSTDIEIYTPKGGYQPRWAPVVLFSPLLLAPGDSYQIFGFRFNGMSQGAAYGDDDQSATNYPLVRITNLETGHVFYSRTHDHSSMAVASHNLVSTHFDVPIKQEPGLSKLEVVANGIPSLPLFVLIVR